MSDIPDTLHDFLDELQSKKAGEPLQVSAIERQVWMTKLKTDNLAVEISRLINGPGALERRSVIVEHTGGGNYFAYWYYSGGTIGLDTKLRPVMQDRGRGGDMDGQAKARYWQSRYEMAMHALRELYAIEPNSGHEAVVNAKATLDKLGDLKEFDLDTELFESNKRQASNLRWAERAFGHDIVDNMIERAARHLEESVELFQAVAMERAKQEGEPAMWGDFMLRAQTLSEAVLDSVWKREPGHVPQEVGGCMVTLAVLCRRLGISMVEEWRRETNRILSKPIEHFRRRMAEKRQAGLQGF